MKGLRSHAWLAIVLLLAGSAAGGEQWRQVEARFGFRALAEGEEFAAILQAFSITPQVDRAQRPTGFAVEVDLRRVSSGNPDRDAEMASAEWFDVDNHPLARFRADRVEMLTPGAYVTRGELSLKGVTRPLDVPFAWRTTPQGLEMTGEVSLDRRWFGVGPQDDSSVAAEVRVFFDFSWAGDAT